MTYIDLNGQQYKFFDSWDQVPMSNFCRWNEIAKNIESATEILSAKYEEHRANSEQIALCSFNGEPEVKKQQLEQKAKQLEFKIAQIEGDLDAMYIDGIACFCDVPVAELALMQKDYSPMQPEQTLAYYKALLINLAQKPLPSDAISSFYFQTETDSFIEELKAKIKKFGRLWFIFPKCWQYKKQLKKASVGLYQIQDIWLMSTFANKELVDLANALAENVKQGDFSGLLYLIAMLTVESGQEKTLSDIQQGTAKQYKERYLQAFQDIYKKREAIFAHSKNPLTVGTVIRIKNFFLSN
jgi:hypothetical protein